MVEIVGLMMAVLAILLSVYWWNSKKQQQSAVKTSASKVDQDETADDSKKQTQQTKRQQSPKKSGIAANKKKPKSPKVPSDPRFIRRYGGHAGAITSFAISPDGQWLATAGTDGKIRVNKADEPGFDLSCTVKTHGMGVFQDHLSAISWLPAEKGQNPTLVGFIDKSRQIAFYRIRLRKDAAQRKATMNACSEYELIELPKKRFDVSTKLEENAKVTDCRADQTHPNRCLVLTKTEYFSNQPQQKHPNTIVWNADEKSAAGSVHVNSPGIRLSPDGSFVCGRGGVGAPEAKIYEVRRKKVKGEIEPVFDSIPSKSVITLVPKASAKIADVAFCGECDNLKRDRLRLGIVACEDGTIEAWDLDVDFRQKEDPRFVCSARLGFDDGDLEVVCMAASVATTSEGSAIYRIAVATNDSALHLLSYNIEKTELLLDFVIERSHSEEGVGGLQFCPSSGNVLYSIGKNYNTKDVYSWKLS